MRTALAVRSTALVSLAFVLAACGGSSAGQAGAVASASAADTPAQQCFAIANAKHDPKPNEPDAISVSHILIEHKDARSPKVGVVRTREAACLLAMDVQKKLSGGADFQKLVTEYSDSKGVSGDGAIGSVHRSDLDPAFAAAAFQLDPGQMSNVVETPLGFHVIVRTE